MAEAFKPVRPGDPLPTNNQLWNSLISVARGGRNQQPLPSSIEPSLAQRPPDILIKNDSPNVFGRGAILPQPNRRVIYDITPEWSGSGVGLQSYPVIRTAVVIDGSMLAYEDFRSSRSVFVTAERILPGKIGGAYTHGVVLALLVPAFDIPWELDPLRATPFFQRMMRFARPESFMFRTSFAGFNIVYTYPVSGFVFWGLVDISQYHTMPKKAIVRVSPSELRSIHILPDAISYGQAKALTDTQIAQFPSLVGGYTGDFRNNFYLGAVEEEDPFNRFKDRDLIWIHQLSDGTWAPIATDFLPYQPGCTSLPYLPRLDIPLAANGPIEKLGYQNGCLVRCPSECGSSAIPPPPPPPPP
jgi:hypothetical protein